MNTLNKRGQITKLEKELNAKQIDQLVNWLTKEKLTYKATIARLQECFGVNSSFAGLSNFYRAVCVPRLVKSKSISPDSGILLDVLIKRRKDNSIQIKILQRGRSVALFGSKSIRRLTP